MARDEAAQWNRRMLIGGLATSALLAPIRTIGAVAGPAGLAGPRTRLPRGTVDAHHHIYDSRYPIDPMAPRRPADASIADYRALQARLGFHRHVIVQPSLYGTDNRLLLDALAVFGAEARGVAVIDPAIADSDLRSMNAKGVCGVRFNLSSPNGAPVATMQAVAARLQPLGWHIQIVAKPDRIIEHADLFGSLPVPVVFDHLAQIGAPGTDHPAFKIVSDLMRRQKAWVKISGLYTFGRSGSPAYPDAEALMRGYLKVAPTRLVWGTDWPHPTLDENSKPDDALLVDLVAGWLGSDRLRRQVFAANPAKLYGFA